jgi:hypothetical protein
MGLPPVPACGACSTRSDGVPLAVTRLDDVLGSSVVYVEGIRLARAGVFAAFSVAAGERVLGASRLVVAFPGGARRWVRPGQSRPPPLTLLLPFQDPGDPQSRVSSEGVSGL